MGTLKDKADALRDAAASLTRLIDAMPRRVGDIIRTFVPANCLLSYRQELELRHANDPDYIRFTVNAAGNALGRHIADKLRAEFKGLKRDDFDYPHCDRTKAIYEAQLVCLTREQLRVLVERAIEAGAAHRIV